MNISKMMMTIFLLIRMDLNFSNKTKKLNMSGLIDYMVMLVKY
jgi:hypothetical protein